MKKAPSTTAARLQVVLDQFTQMAETTSNTKHVRRVAYQQLYALHDALAGSAATEELSLQHRIKAMESSLLARFYELDDYVELKAPTVDQDAAAQATPEEPRKKNSLTKSQQKSLKAEMQRALDAVDNNNPAEALAAYSRILSVHPKHSAALKGRCLMLLETKQPI